MSSKIVILGNSSKNRLNYYVWKDVIDDIRIRYIPDVIKWKFGFKILSFVERGCLHFSVNGRLSFLRRVGYKIGDSNFKGKFSVGIPGDTSILICSHISLYNIGSYKLKQLKQGGTKVILFLFDSMSTVSQRTKELIVDAIDRNVVDECYSFDESDCHNYKFKYWPQVYSPLKINIKRNEYVADVYFAGRDRGRFQIVEKCLKRLTDSGLSALCRMPDADVARFKSMNARCETSLIEYEKTVWEMLSCRCILDIVQEGQTGISWRVVEAIVYHKKLITNNPCVLSNKYYDPRYIQYFKDVDDIDFSWVGQDISMDFVYEDDYSPVRFIDMLSDNEAIGG